MESFHVPATHPALPGHFPHAPVVPGVILLDRVAAAIERAWAKRICALPQVKFLSPVLPDEHVQMNLIDDGRNVRFNIIRGDTTVASGLIEMAP